MSTKVRGNDNVLLYFKKKKTYLVTVKSNKTLHTHRGYIKLDNLIGKRYGETVKSHLNEKFIILKPTIRDYILKYTRKTQIIYPKDIALMILYSGIGPGSIVVEAGTGTGALTSALAYYVKPTGKVYSYEVREEFLLNAKKNLEKAGLIDYVELKLKDITKGIDEENVDAIFLDLATPWLVVPYAYKALADWGTFISFSPTIEQIAKTVKALRENNFIAIECIECIVRRIMVSPTGTRPETRMIGHTGYILFARKLLEEEYEKS